MLRIDDPGLDEPLWQHLDTGPGKRSALLNLRETADYGQFAALLRSADVLVLGYRPGALDRFGLSPEQLAAEYPGLVVARLSAWGSTGPWASRRGFDSIVQAASGIADIEGEEGKPGALPAQALDHAAGYIVAAAILSALDRRRATRAGASIDVALARIAAELLARPHQASVLVDADASPIPSTVEFASDVGSVRMAEPAIGYQGGPQTWPAPSRRWGHDAPTWGTA